MTGAESAKECCQCRQTKPLSEFYSRKDRDGRRVPFKICKSCYAPANRSASLRYYRRQKALLESESPPSAPPPPPSRPEPIPLSDRIERIRRDAQDLVWILRRYMLRDARGVCYLRLRPREGDPKRRAIVLAAERLVTAVWDAGLGNAALGFGPVDPRTNREMSAHGIKAK